MELMPVLALDCGGSRSSALLIQDSHVLAEFEASPANLKTSGPYAVAAVVAELARRARGARAVAAAVAGLRTEEERLSLVRAVRAAGVELPIAAWSDGHAALRSGGASWGVALIAGTGSGALAVTREGAELRCGGWGSTLGDEGSGYWIGLMLLRHATRAHDDRALSLSLQRAVLAALGVPDMDAVRGVSRSRDSVRSIAALAPLVGQLYREGDDVARGIVERAEDELARLVRLAASHAALPAPVPVVITGGVSRGLPHLSAAIAARLGPSYSVHASTRDPAWGAYWLGLEYDAWDVDTQAGPSPITESGNDETASIDPDDSLGFLRAMNREDAKVAGAVEGAVPMIERLVVEVADRLRAGGRLVYLGAGTSGRLGVLDAAECPPTFGVDPSRVVALMAGGEAALTRAIEGAEDDAGAGASAVRAIDVGARDVVVGLSASGSAPYVSGGLEAARTLGAFTSLLTCNPAASLLDEVDVPLCIAVGPEVIAGSSRLKAATAQKLVLNMISTCTMVRLGRVAGGKMVAFRPTNQKLRRRAVRLVAQLTGAAEDAARHALETCDWEVGEATLYITLGSRERAREAMTQHEGDVRRALRVNGVTWNSD